MPNPPLGRRASPLEPASPASGGVRSLNPDVMSSAVGGLEEAASLLARGILRRRLADSLRLRSLRVCSGQAAQVGQVRRPLQDGCAQVGNLCYHGRQAAGCRASLGEQWCCPATSNSPFGCAVVKARLRSGMAGGSFGVAAAWQAIG